MGRRGCEAVTPTPTLLRWGREYENRVSTERRPGHRASRSARATALRRARSIAVAQQYTQATQIFFGKHVGQDGDGARYACAVGAHHQRGEPLADIRFRPDLAFAAAAAAFDQHGPPIA